MKKSADNIIEFTLYYNRYKAKLYNYVLKMVNNNMLCEDIIQNVFLKFFENLNTIRIKNSIGYWLFKTARNDIYSYYRTKKIRADQFNVKDPNEINFTSSENLAEVYELKELKNLIMKELDYFSHEQRDIYLLREYGGLSYKEIAGIMEIDENLVKSRLYKTRQKLIDRISKII